MKKIFSLIVFLLAGLSGFSQSSYWQQQVDFTISVALNDEEHSLTGFEKITYINNSPDTLHFIWFHLWPNAYKNDKTAFSDQLLENGNTRFYFSTKEQKGYINKLDFKVDNKTAVLEDHPNYIDVAKLLLPSPLPPGKQINITTPFHVKLPFNFSRGGHDGQSYQCTQWYPKPAVYDKNGWHEMPYLDQGEFYSNFGTYDVSIAVPDNYVVAATGILQNQEEKEWLKLRGDFIWEPIATKEKTVYGPLKKSIQGFPASSKKSKTLRYVQQNVHDFAWFADKRFIVNHDVLTLPSGKKVEAYTYYTPTHKLKWQHSLQYTKEAVRFYSQKVGDYPYDVVQVVQGPKSFGGGMEYPTITVLAPGGNSKELDLTIAHEIGHNWFYGVLATNERKNPWMDEGMNSFYEEAYAKEKYGASSKMTQLFFESKAVAKSDQPIADSSEVFSAVNYYLSVYYKAAEWMNYAQQVLGTDVFQKAIQQYYSQWKFKHPQPQDFKKVMEEVSGKKLDSLFAYLHTKGRLPNQERSGTKIALTVNPKSISDYFKNPSKNLITIAPIAGFNSYDKFMIGLLATNMKFPPSKFNFLVAPMYASGSKKINGIAGAWYSFIPEKMFGKIDVGISGSKFSASSFANDIQPKAFLSFSKIVPSLRLGFKEKNPRSTVSKFLQFKSFIIKEDGLQFYRDTVRIPPDTIISTKFNVVNVGRTLNQLKFVIENYRALYPYRGEIKVEQGKDFVRAGFTGSYFFNYAKGGGLSIRFFAGKFFYTASKTISRQFATDRYHLNMTGPNGYEDYTYSDYFVGRNKFEGFASQQIMERDGAFKVRTDLLADKVGKTDNWLMATNFTTTIPKALNPLSMLPFDVPVKLFADIGTYAEAWKPNAGLDRFVFDAGLQLSLFKETINIYLPMVYSKIYKDYILSTIPKQGRIWKKISFSIDISNFSLKKVDRNLIF